MEYKYWRNGQRLIAPIYYLIDVLGLRDGDYEFIVNEEYNEVDFVIYSPAFVWVHKFIKLANAYRQEMNIKDGNHFTYLTVPFYAYSHGCRPCSYLFSKDLYNLWYETKSYFYLSDYKYTNTLVDDYKAQVELIAKFIGE